MPAILPAAPASFHWQDRRRVRIANPPSVSPPMASNTKLEGSGVSDAPPEELDEEVVDALPEELDEGVADALPEDLDDVADDLDDDCEPAGTDSSALLGALPPAAT